MGYIVSIDSNCMVCKNHVGENYTTRENGLHTEARCGVCNTHIKFLSKSDKYGTKEQEKQIWQKTRGRCLYCGDRLSPFDKRGYTYEHLEPQALGGGHETENLYPCCKSCNSQKGKKTLEDYREYMQAKNALPKHVFYFEVLEYSTLGEHLKAIF